MDNEEAKLILSTWRPGQDAGEGDALLEEALALMENDSSLADWFAQQCAMDAAMSGALSTVEPPAHLREAILASARITSFPARRRLPLAWLAAAACVVLALGVAFLLPNRSGSLSLAKLKAEIPGLTSAHAHSFADGGGDLEKIRSWLAAHGGVADFTIPAGLVNRGAVGCEVASINGTKVSILCFHLDEGRTAHLYIVDRAQMAEAPPPGTPQINQQGAYAVASWSQNGNAYFLAQQGSAEGLRQLL